MTGTLLTTHRHAPDALASSGSAADPSPAVREVDARPTVCQIVHSLGVGGAEVLAAEMARTLKHRFRFVFVCLDEIGRMGNALLEEGFPIHVLDRRPGIDLKCAIRLAAVMRQERVDLIHAHQYTPYFQAALARQFYRRPPIVFTEHGRHYPDSRSWKRVLANRLLFQERDHILGVGRSVRQALVENEGFPEARVGVIYNGVDLSPYHQNHEEYRASVRAELALADDFLVMQVARLNHLKDHGTAIRAAEIAAEQIPNLRLVLVGEGEENEALQSYVRERNLENLVRFLGVRRDIPRLLAAADVFLLSSISEGIPLTIIEAMASEVPVVSTDVGGIGEMIQSGQNGFLVPSRDAAGLARHIVHLGKNPDLRRWFGRLGRQRALELFSQRRMNESYLLLYEELIRG